MPTNTKYLLLRVTLAFIFALISSSDILAQSKGKNLDIDGKVYENGSKLAGVVVEVLLNGTEYKKLVTPSNGGFKFSLDGFFFISSA